MDHQAYRVLFYLLSSRYKKHPHTAFSGTKADPLSMPQNICLSSAKKVILYRGNLNNKDDFQHKEQESRKHT